MHQSKERVLYHPPFSQDAGMKTNSAVTRKEHSKLDKARLFVIISLVTEFKDNPDHMNQSATSHYSRVTETDLQIQCVDHVKKMNIAAFT